MSRRKENSIITRRHALAATGAAGLVTASNGLLAGEKKRPPRRRVKPLSAAHRKALAAIPRDPPPENLTQNQHYVVSDEAYPERFAKTLKGQGGLYVGTGPEQNYLFAGWARPEVIVLFDFDQTIVDLHALYRIFMQAVATPTEFVATWENDNRHDAIALIKAATKNPDRSAMLTKLYRSTSPRVVFQLRLLQRRHKALGLETFVTAQEPYDYFRQMFDAGRIRAVRGDFTAKAAMAGIASAAKTLGVTLRSLYLSNVEQYFDYDKVFRKNIRLQPTDERSLVLRTAYSGKTKKDRYSYCRQSHADFQSWLTTDVRDLQSMFHRAFRRIKRDEKVLILPGPA